MNFRINKFSQALNIVNIICNGFIIYARKPKLNFSLRHELQQFFPRAFIMLEQSCWGCVRLQRIQCLEPVISPGVNQPGRQDDHSVPTSVKDKKEWSCSSPPYICLHRVNRLNFVLITKKISKAHFVTKTSVVLKNFRDFTTEAFSSNTSLRHSLHCLISGLYWRTEMTQIDGISNLPYG